MSSTYGNRGMTFESLIEYANSRYRHTGAAIVEKQHTLCKPLRNGTGSIVSAKYEEKATVDFIEAAKPHTVTWTWVKGHDGHPDNERCDSLAVTAAGRPQEELLHDDGKAMREAGKDAAQDALMPAT